MHTIVGEAVFIRLYDVGRSIDLNRVLSVLPGIRDRKFIRTKDTPPYIFIPETISLTIHHDFEKNPTSISKLELEIKLYEYGVISFIAKLNVKEFPLEQMHKIRKMEFRISESLLTIDKYLDSYYHKIYSQIEVFIDKTIYGFNPPEEENYACFCITNDVGDPYEFIKKHKEYLAAFLMGESPELNLHYSQVKSTLNYPFSFLKNDLVIFDLDRCLIIDPNQDYDDILLIVELANYQLLELRTLDHFLDESLDIAENDIRSIFFDRFKLWKKLNKRLGQLFRLRIDMEFILDNIENVSKIIGDYFLAQILTFLSDLFQLDKWTTSIRNRLNLLDNLYSTAKTSANERILLIVEILLGVVFTLEFILFLIEFLYLFI